MPDAAPADSLCVIWTNADREVALNLAFMYAGNAIPKGWWKQVRLIVWGPAQKTLASDPEVQTELYWLADAGVEVLACRQCAENYGLVESLAALGVDVRYTGEPLTRMLKSGWKVLTC